MRDTAVAVEFSPGTGREVFDAAVQKLEGIEFSQRLIGRDPSLFSDDPTHQKIITNRLGWLESYRHMRKAAPGLEAFAREVADAGLRQVVLLGMGGSSLCPEVLGKVFGLPPHLDTYIVLDSTAPAAVKQTARATEPNHTLFIVASKSGTTIETRSQADFFFSRQKEQVDKPGLHFVAITDAGSVLEEWGKRAEFRRVFLNPADIGGRFSAISYFGLVPAALLGIDLSALLEGVEAAARLEANSGPGQRLGAFLYACASQGRDKITFFSSPGTAPLIPWVEQLLAESTGKEEKGIFPIEGEPTGRAGDYGDDRAFIVTRFAHEPNGYAPLLGDLRARALPIAEMVLDRPETLGAAFLHWEWATAAVGSMLQVDPFDEPNVKESKDNTSRLLEQFGSSGHLPVWPATAQTDEWILRARGVSHSPGADANRVLSAWLSGIRRGDYLAVLAYLAPTEQAESDIAGLRRFLRDLLGVATLRGWGPRFLHSIGQLYKGGPANGHFMIVTQQSRDDLAIPGRPYTFGQLIAAQAMGDADALAARGRPVVQVELIGDPVAALRSLGEYLRRL